MSWVQENRRLLLIAIAIVMIAMIIVVNYDFLTEEVFSIDNILRYMVLPTWVLVLIFLALYALKGAILVVSAILLYVLAGLIFPIWAAFLVTYAGLAVSLSVGYLIGNKLGEHKVNKMIAKQKRIADFVHGNKENLVMLCFVARLFPMSYGLVSMLFGALKVPFFKYLFMSLLGISPRMIPIVLAGRAIANPLSAEFMVPFAISLCVTLGIFVIYNSTNSPT